MNSKTCRNSREEWGCWSTNKKGRKKEEKKEEILRRGKRRRGGMELDKALSDVF